MGKTVAYMSYYEEPALIKISHLWQNKRAQRPHEICL